MDSTATKCSIRPSWVSSCICKLLFRQFYSPFYLLGFISWYAGEIPFRRFQGRQKTFNSAKSSSMINVTSRGINLSDVVDHTTVNPFVVTWRFCRLFQVSVHFTRKWDVKSSDAIVIMFFPERYEIAPWQWLLNRRWPPGRITRRRCWILSSFMRGRVRIEKVERRCAIFKEVQIVSISFSQDRKMFYSNIVITIIMSAKVFFFKATDLNQITPHMAKRVQSSSLFRKI